jgi:hypothetical protein
LWSLSLLLLLSPLMMMKWQSLCDNQQHPR